MLYVLLFCLIAFFAYALGLVISNDADVAVNLLFIPAPEMNLGLLLIVSIILGFFIGVIFAMLAFRVLQKHLEISRLNKEIKTLTNDNETLKKDLEVMRSEKVTLDMMMKEQKLKDEFEEEYTSINND